MDDFAPDDWLDLLSYRRRFYSRVPTRAHTIHCYLVWLDQVIETGERDDYAFQRNVAIPPH